MWLKFILIYNFWIQSQWIQSYLYVDAIYVDARTANLSCKCCKPNDQKYVVAINPIEYIVLVVHLPRINLVEERHESKSVEYERVMLRWIWLKHLNFMSTLDVQPPFIRSWLWYNIM